MSTSPSSAGSRGGLSNAIDIIIAPNAAFDRIRAVPTWVWPFVIATVLGIVGALLTQPAVVHAMETAMPAQFAANPAIAKLPPEQQQKQIAAMMGFAMTMTKITWLFTPFIILLVGLIQGLVLTIANAIGKGGGNFARFFALSITVCIVGSGLYYLVLGLIVLVRGPAGFDTMIGVNTAVPSLALLAPTAQGFVVGFLAAFNVFYLWAAALLALGTIRIGRVSPAIAWTAAALIVLGTACMLGLSSRTA